MVPSPGYMLARKLGVLTMEPNVEVCAVSLVELVSDGLGYWEIDSAAPKCIWVWQGEVKGGISCVIIFGSGAGHK